MTYSLRLLLVIGLQLTGSAAASELSVAMPDLLGTIDFVEVTGGENLVVVSVTLFREGTKAIGAGASGPPRGHD